MIAELPTKSVREKPILFKGEMVRAVLDDRKTQTRRIVKPQPEMRGDDDWLWKGGPILLNRGYGAPYVHTDRHSMMRAVEKCCHKGQPGDRLWVKETFGVESSEGVSKVPWYRADFLGHSEVDPPPSGTKWKPSIFMPRKFSRITLEITGVRVERLQDISEEDAKAEGVPDEGYAVHYYCDEGDPNDPEDFGVHRCNWRFGYKMLWNEINGAGSWDLNPWVWVIEFRKL